MDEQFPEPAWFPDPTGRHERRWWSGDGWTGHVEDGSHRLFDLGGIPPGWQTDALGGHELRYWDGTRWTDQTAN